MRTTTVDLRAEATAEARRVAGARALFRECDQQALLRLEGDAIWIAKPRRASLKRSLGGRVCLVWRVAFEDASGRFVESKLVPVLVEVPRSADCRSSTWMELFLREADAPVRARLEIECEAWRAEVLRAVRALSSARLRREREITARPTRSRPDVQGGLFDRRAERSREDQASATAESGRIAAVRLGAIHAAARIAPAPARLLLVLLP